MTKYNISSFEEIGIVDPFPDDKIQKRNFKIPQRVNEIYDIEQLVYHESRYCYNENPKLKKNIFCIFIPSKEVMFKLMRASIHVSSESELWFNYNDVSANY